MPCSAEAGTLYEWGFKGWIQERESTAEPGEKDSLMGWESPWV